MAYEFKIGEYKSVDGGKVRIVADDIPGDQPLLGYYCNEDGGVTPATWSRTGKFLSLSNYCFCDLVPPEAWTVEWHPNSCRFFRDGIQKFDAINICGGKDTIEEALDALNAWKRRENDTDQEPQP